MSIADRAATDEVVPPSESSDRLPGPDVVRAVALIGVVVMNYHGYLMFREEGFVAGDSALDRFFDPFEGPLSTRFASTFVLTAGVGITLLTRRVVADRAAGSVGASRAVTEMRWRLVRRGLALYVLGQLLDVIWPGTIIVYYGAMFAIASLLFTLATRWIVAIGLAAAARGVVDLGVVVLARRGRCQRDVAACSRVRFDSPVRLRHRRERHASAAAVVVVPLCGHRARADVGRARLAAVVRRTRTVAVRRRHDRVIVGRHAVHRSRAVSSPVRPRAGLRGQRTRHVADRVRRDLVARRSGDGSGRRGGRGPAAGGSDDAHALHRAHSDLQPGGRLARLGRARWARNRARRLRWCSGSSPWCAVRCGTVATDAARPSGSTGRSAAEADAPVATS